MLAKILKYLKYGNHFCGVEHYSNKGQDILHVSLIKQSKNELNIASSLQAESISDVSKNTPKNQHITLVINTDKVLSKTIESTHNDTSKILYNAFPNLDLDEFYYDILTEGHLHFISLCRKDYIDSIIENYTKEKLYIINVTLGNTIISTLKPFLTIEEVQTSNAIITFVKNTITLISKDKTEPNKYDINGIKVSNQEILSFSGALQSVVNNSVVATNFKEKKSALTRDFQSTRFFNQFLKFGGLFILVLLLVNFFLFNHYFNKVNELNQVSEINQSTKTQILQLNEKVSKKQKMVEDLLKSNGSRSSFYSNQLIHNLPKSILLSEFNYQPLAKQIKPDKKIELYENSIIILGNSNDGKAFTNWISRLEKENWIQHVDIVEYRKTTLNNSVFELKLILGDD